jgi:hypothetical protein
MQEASTGLAAKDRADGGPRPRPDIESVHRDLDFANAYRLELIKTVMTLAAGLLAFTVAFRPSLKPIAAGWLVWPGWLGLGLSLIGALFNMLGWEHFYLSYHDYDYKGKATEGVTARARIKQWRRPCMLLQFSGFILGVLCVAIFAALNLGNVVIHE